MEDSNFIDIFGDSESEDEEFLGFNDEDIVGNNYAGHLEDIEFDDTIRKIEEEVREDTDPRFEAYDCEWLQQFNAATGPVGCDNDLSPYDIFSKYIDEEVIDHLVKETNHYYDQIIEAKGGVETLSKCARAKSWQPVTTSEMRVFIAIILYMGLVRMPNYEMYWSTNDLIGLKNFTSLMSRGRFMGILTFFHASDNTQQHARDHPAYDAGYKVNVLAKLLIGKWQSTYNMDREISVDETLIPFKGRTKLLNYIPSKPHKWGVKV